MCELDWKIAQLQEIANNKLAKLIEQYWDLLDMMIYEGYTVNWEALGF